MKKILIVEDNLIISQMYRQKFELSGYEIAVAHDGAKALESAEKFKPDMILLDVMLPEMNGDEVLAKLRAKKEFADTKVTVLTNTNTELIENNFAALDVLGFLLKSEFKPKQVVEYVNKHMKS
jgi:two-component system alkaline phosphatase synthesis response regulator PhoP